MIEDPEQCIGFLGATVIVSAVILAHVFIWRLIISLVTGGF